MSTLDDVLAQQEEGVDLVVRRVVLRRATWDAVVAEAARLSEGRDVPVPPGSLMAAYVVRGLLQDHHGSKVSLAKLSQVQRVALCRLAEDPRGIDVAPGGYSGAGRDASRWWRTMRVLARLGLAEKAGEQSFRLTREGAALLNRENHRINCGPGVCTCHVREGVK